MAVKKRKNAVARYFTPFGLRQICDIMLVTAAIILILGLSLFDITVLLLPIGLGMFIAGGLLAIYRSARIMMGGVNRRSPEFKQALVNTIVMAVLTATAIFGMFFYFFRQI